jgi:alpha-tubulin suppressor-like RCC1 family protein
MSSYLWRYYLENDAERFQRLLQGSQSTHRTTASKLTTPLGSLKSSPAGILAKQHRSGEPPGNVVITKKMLAELDAMGRSILHHACTEPDRLAFVTVLLAHPLIDPGLVDLESGWTCLHRALYHGNISAAREIISANPSNWSLVKSKDRAGDSPFDIFEASIRDIGNVREESHPDVDEDSDDGQDDDEPVAEWCPQGKGDEVFSWGSNKNMTLGFMDGDDRSYPERILLPRPKQLLLEEAKRRYSGVVGNHGKTPEELLDASVLFDPVNFEDILLSKYHTAILTTDRHSNLFICGFGRGGRLGFGDEQNVQYTFRPMVPPLLPKKKVERVALGQDHTVVVLHGGEVWTWGSNQHGQLGYTIQQKSLKDEPIMSTPRQVLGLLRKEPVIGCAASKVHTAVFTADSLFTWGRNDGQLGILDSSDARMLEVQTSPRKVAANFLNGSKFKEVVAIDKATVVLLENHEVWILAGHGYWRLTFPMERFVGLPGAKNITRYDTGLNFIKKITGGGDIVCFLSQNGDVFLLDVDATLKERSSRGGKVVWSPTRAWSLRKKHMAVRDVDVGAEGNIIICTESGSVWSRAKRAKINDSGDRRYKFNRVPGLTRITTVRSTTTGAFAAIRKDSDVMRTGLVVEPPLLWDDVGQMLSFGGLFDEEDEAEDTGRVNDDEEWGYGPQPRPPGYGKAVQWFMQVDVEDELKEYLRDLELHEGLESWDMAISTSKCDSVNIPVHAFILSRSPVLRKLIADGVGSIPGVDIAPWKDGKRRLVFHDVELLTVLNLAYYLYIDTIIDLWHQRGISKAKQEFFKSLRAELSQIAAALDLKPLLEAVGRMHYPPRCLHHDLQLAYRDPKFFHTADMAIDVADGDSLMVHSALMRLRCPFFEALYGGGSSGRWLLGRQTESEVIHVDMKHVPKDIMEKVVSWLYHDWGTEGFDGVRVGVDDIDVDQFLDFVLDVMSTANELMLERLGQVCQKVIGRYVNTRNAAGLLMSIAPCSEKGFKEQCLQYICSNLETMLENRYSSPFPLLPGIF